MGNLPEIERSQSIQTSAGSPRPNSGEFGYVDSAYCNPDLAPTGWDERRWGLKDLAALWIALAACIPTYMLASSLIEEGMNWWQAILTICLGNLIVLIPKI